MTMGEGYKDLILILVKGRHRVQVRLIEPVASNINSGDNYILVTPTEIYNFIGKYSRNVAERMRSADIASTIQKYGELGCSADRVITITEGEPTCSPDEIRSFWTLLGAENQEEAVTKEAGHPDEDKLYEIAVLKTNMVYELIRDKLVPFAEYCGVIPKIEMLDSTKTMVFDFGTEMYVWNGKESLVEHRSLAYQLAEELWERGYDYEDSVICPFTPVPEIAIETDRSSEDNMSPTRPDWCLIAKISELMEPILFREKFRDWPNPEKIIRMKGHVDLELGDGSTIVEPFDIALLEPKTEPVDLVLEGIHLGRGTEWVDEEVIHWENKAEITSFVESRGLKAWHVDETTHTELEASSFGQFHGGDSYIIRWMYRINTTGRQLGGRSSKYPSIGRDRFAYFIWQGSKSSQMERGSAAVLTVMMDGENGPQVRVVQGFEPPAFLSRFSGGMVVHLGDKMTRESDSRYRLYACRGAVESEASLVEVPCVMENLRSRSSFVLLDTEAGRLYVWHGTASLPHIRTIALYAASRLQENSPVEAGITGKIEGHIIEMDEGDEVSEFRDALGDDSTAYLRLSTVPEHTPRLFHVTMATGEFAPSEQLCCHRADDIVLPYPFLQRELLRVTQPALFLFDDEDKLWLWQGWWPEADAEDKSGNGAVRFQAERRALMTTALTYWKTKHPDTPPAIFLVWAGLEPMEFTNLFPMWERQEEIAELNTKDGHEPGAILSIDDELKKLTRSTYTLAELLERPLGVDPTNLEEFLSPEDFQDAFGMTIEEFQELPAWRQDNMKKDVGLF